MVGKITERSAHKYNLERTIPNVMDRNYLYNECLYICIAYEYTVCISIILSSHENLIIVPTMIIIIHTERTNVKQISQHGIMNKTLLIYMRKVFIGERIRN